MYCWNGISFLFEIKSRKFVNKVESRTNIFFHMNGYIYNSGILAFNMTENRNIRYSIVTFIESKTKVILI